MSETTWPQALTALLNGEDLSVERAAWVMDQVMSGSATPAQLSAFLVALRAKGESTAEMVGLSQTMLQYANRFEVPGVALDIVGTGGDGAHTVNISTMSSLVAAGAGVRVVKHGNRAASSKTGTADVLEKLGVRLDLSPEQVAQVAGEAGITFCFAAMFHPAMKYAGGVRKEIGIPTAFNFLGPLTNPAQPKYGAIGVANERMAPLMANVFAERRQSVAVFRGDDGLDEISPAITSHVWWVTDGTVSELILDPREVGVNHPVSALVGGDADFNAGAVQNLLAGEQGAVRDTVVLNAGLALAVLTSGETGLAAPTNNSELHDRVRAGMKLAEDSLDSGAAQQALARWVKATSVV
ncbi:anthranilate phosphoribosyltransferase [Ornithinimicrobium sp. Arc0846-15]|nr:anthranilate phosphoribosyltransferase [Ornithinimicrobium laminariae]